MWDFRSTGPTAAVIGVRFALATGAGVALLAGCGSTSHAAAINAGLRRLQAELEQKRPKLDTRGKDVLGHVTLVYAAPPKGIGTAEWEQAVKRDRPLQRAIARASE
jgi:hypothetical protein